MPRLPRSYSQTSFFHVMTQGINKNHIFKESSDIKFYIKTMYRLKEEYNIKIIAYCIMINHAHILVEIKELNNLSKFMHKLNMIFGMHYNKKYNRVGYVFRDRFKSEGIYSEKQLYCCINYIYNNPVKAGICKYPGEYLYSNYKNINVETEDNFSFIDIEEQKKIELKDVVNDFLNENDITFINLRKNKEKLIRLIEILNKKYNFSLRKISSELGIGRDTLRKWLNS